jgi:excisionase family DNA binding protein
MEKQYLSPDEVGEIIGFSARTVIGMIRRGELKAKAVGNGTEKTRYRIWRKWVEEYMQTPSEPAKPMPAVQRPTLVVRRHMKRLG